MSEETNFFKLSRDPNAIQISVHFMNLVEYSSTKEVLDALENLVSYPHYYFPNSKETRTTYPVMFRVVELVSYYGQESVINYVSLVYNRKIA